MKTNASLGDLAGHCKLFGVVNGKNMLAESSRYGAAFAAGIVATEGKLA